MPLLGVVKVTDRTIDDLAAELQRRYAQYYVNPQVVVEFVTDQKSGGAMPWGYVTVLGRVKKPGRVFIPATRDLTVSAAIQEAGGLDTSAKDTAIRLTRVGDDAKTQSQEVNLRAVGTKGELAGDLALRPGDVIYVPELVF
jgi:protein involved in polysaccharide export with SLBB domain